MVGYNYSFSTAVSMLKSVVSIVPVSYTHLDVYKRQVQEPVQESSGNPDPDRSNYLSQEYDGQIGLVVPDGYQVERQITCLLYTSRPSGTGDQ